MNKASWRANGWVVTVALGIVSCIMLGITMGAPGMILVALAKEFNSTYERVSSSTMLFVATMTLSMPIVGWLMNWISARAVMLTGVLITSVSYLVAARSNSIDLFILAMGGAGFGIGMSTYVPSICVISTWINDRKALAYGLYMCGSSLGAIIFPFIMAHQITLHGWRQTLEQAAFLMFFVSAPVLLWLVRSRSEAMMEVVREEEDSKSMHGLMGSILNPRYWLLILMQSLLTSGVMGLYSYVVPFLTSMGYSSKVAAVIFGGIGVAAMAGFPLFGVIADRYGARRALLLGIPVCALGVGVLLFANDQVGLILPILFVIMWGSTFNLSSQLSPLLLADLLGSRYFSFLLGLKNLIAGLISAVAPVITGWILDAEKSYSTVFKVWALAYGLALIPVLLMPARRKISISVLKKSSREQREFECP